MTAMYCDCGGELVYMGNNSADVPVLKCDNCGKKIEAGWLDPEEAAG